MHKIALSTLICLFHQAKCQVVHICSSLQQFRGDPDRTFVTQMWDHIRSSIMAPVALIVLSEKTIETLDRLANRSQKL